MSGTAGIGTLFAAAVTATGAQLDANYDTLVVYLNDPTNRNNYGQGGAVTNTVAVTFSPPVVGGYTSGLELTWKWGTLNTGAVVLNANGLGGISLVNPDGSALQAGQGLAGSIGKAVYDGTRAIYLSPPSPATQAQMETATASATFVSPAMVRQSPYASKAWAVFDGVATGTTSVSVGFGISSVVRGGTGSYTINFANPFQSTGYAVALTPENPPGAAGAAVNAKTTAAMAISTYASNTGVVFDCTRVSVICFGDLP